MSGISKRHDLHLQSDVHQIVQFFLGLDRKGRRDLSPATIETIVDVRGMIRAWTDRSHMNSSYSTGPNAVPHVAKDTRQRQIYYVSRILYLSRALRERPRPLSVPTYQDFHGQSGILLLFCLGHNLEASHRPICVAYPPSTIPSLSCCDQL